MDFPDDITSVENILAKDCTGARRKSVYLRMILSMYDFLIFCYYVLNRDFWLWALIVSASVLVLHSILNLFVGICFGASAILSALILTGSGIAKKLIGSLTGDDLEMFPEEYLNIFLIKSLRSLKCSDDEREAKYMLTGGSNYLGVPIFVSKLMNKHFCD
jgi:hypothetical protein